MDQNKKKITVFLLLLTMLLTIPARLTAAAQTPSPFSILDPEEAAVATYHFYDETGEHLLNTQKVKDKERVYAINVPQKEKHQFLGWAKKEDSNQEVVLQNQDFDAAVTENVTLEYRAVYREVYYVFFIDQRDGNEKVIYTAEGLAGDVISTEKVTFPLDAIHFLEGWYEEPELINRVDSVRLSDRDIRLYAKVNTGYTMTFISGEDADYQKPVFVPSGEVTAEPMPVTRQGYQFLGWKKEGEENYFRFGSALTENITLHAVWKAVPSKYTVIYWTENADDDEYSVTDTKQAEGLTGTAVTNVSIPAISGFENGVLGENEHTKLIKGDGSTIINVYYRRKVFSVSFYRYYTFRGWTEMTDLRITAKYGAVISDRWPRETSKIWATQTSGSQAVAPYQSGIDTMPLNGDRFYYLSQNGYYRYDLNYYTQSLDGEYELAHTDSFQDDQRGWILSEEDFYPIKGFTYAGEKKPGDSFDRVSNYHYEVKLYYERNSYLLHFINGEERRTKTLKYEEALAKEHFIPKPPKGYEEYEFENWFKDETLRQVFSFETKMPSHDVTVYAKWKEPEVSARAYLSMDGKAGYQDLEVRYREMIKEGNMPSVRDANGKLLQSGNASHTVIVPEGYKWVGWFTKDEDGTYRPYSFTTEIRTKGLELHPYYISDQRFLVTYDLNGVDKAPPVDSRQYIYGIYAEVLDYQSEDEEHIFLGWKMQGDESDVLYLPRAKILIKNDITLVAQWGNKGEHASLVYHSNEEESAALAVPNNTQLQLGRIEELQTKENQSFTIPAGYHFAGWEDRETGRIYQAEQTVLIDNEGENHLYALWEKTEMLPDTGGMGSFFFTQIGTFLMAAMLLMRLKDRRKEI